MEKRKFITVLEPCEIDLMPVAKAFLKIYLEQQEKLKTKERKEQRR